jgi:hypothetical protein
MSAKKTPGKDSKFDSILTDAIDEALSVCGERAKSAFYTYLEKALNIPKREIPARVNEFSQTLEELFGVRAHILEILVMKNLHSKIRVVWELKAPNPRDLPNLTFKEYVSVAKRCYEDANRDEDKRDIQIDEYEAREMHM